MKQDSRLVSRHLALWASLFLLTLVTTSSKASASGPDAACGPLARVGVPASSELGDDDDQGMHAVPCLRPGDDDDDDMNLGSHSPWGDDDDDGVNVRAIRPWGDDDDDGANLILRRIMQLLGHQLQ